MISFLVAGPGYQKRDQERITNRVKTLDYSFDPRVDKAMFIDRLKAYASFDVSTRRPVYSKLLKIDESEDIMIQKVDEIYSTEYQTAV